MEKYERDNFPLKHYPMQLERYVSCVRSQKKKQKKNSDSNQQIMLKYMLLQKKGKNSLGNSEFYRLNTISLLEV